MWFEECQQDTPEYNKLQEITVGKIESIIEETFEFEQKEAKVYNQSHKHILNLYKSGYVHSDKNMKILTFPLGTHCVLYVRLSSG